MQNQVPPFHSSFSPKTGFLQPKGQRPSASNPPPPSRLTSYELLSTYCTLVPHLLYTYYTSRPTLDQSALNSLTAFAFLYAAAESCPCQVSLSLVIAWSCVLSLRVASFLVLVLLYCCRLLRLLTAAAPPLAPILHKLSPSLYSAVLICTPSLGLFSLSHPMRHSTPAHNPAYRHPILLLSTLPILTRYKHQSYTPGLSFFMPLNPQSWSFPPSHRRQPRRAIK